MRLIFLLLLLPLSLACGDKDIFPEKILDYRCVKLLEGPEAKKFVDRIHINEVATDQNFIGFYEHGAEQSIIYITKYESSEVATAEWQRMTQKISPENSVFLMGTNFQLGGKTIYRCFGMGQTHFVFSHGTMLIWISTETITANEFLKNYIDYIN